MISKQKLQEWVDTFFAYIDAISPALHVEQEEGYKFKSVETFQKNFDLEAPDLAGMLTRSIEANNLVMGARYFPRLMLLHFAEDYPEETRSALKDLFNEKQDVEKRLNTAMEVFSHLLKKREKAVGKLGHSFIGLRFLSLLLSFRYPERHNAIKPREWKVFCRFVDESFAIPTHTPVGGQYKALEQHIEALRRHIKNMPRAQVLRDQLTRGLSFTDSEFRWMAQDIIYVTARLFAKKRDEQSLKTTPLETDRVGMEDSISQPEEPIEGAEMQFPLEKYLEHFIVENWDKVDFGEHLELYREEDGTPGEQYTTDVGIIDILAKDKRGNFVVIELKRGKSTQHVMGQVLAYIGWVRENLATNGQKVRGLVIVNEGNPALLQAQKEVADKISIKYYRVKLEMTDPPAGEK